MNYLWNIHKKELKGKVLSPGFGRTSAFSLHEYHSFRLEKADINRKTNELEN